MSDFDYETYDISTIKIAFQNLKRAERQGFWLGVLAGFPLGIYIVSRPAIQHKFAAGPISKAASALIVGSLMYEWSNASYGAYIFRARQSYNDVAAKINRKYSILLNKAITYNWWR